MAHSTPRKPNKGIKDVAALAGVSVGTVSNVLNRPDVVAEATREKVLAAIEELGFVRNEPGRQLRAGRSRILAYVMLDAGNPFFTDVAKGIEEVAREHDLALFLCNSANEVERERDYLQLLQQQRVRGVLITPVADDTSGLEALTRQGIPVVLVDHPRDATWCSVAVDDVEGGSLAVNHLCDEGHERIAFVGGPMTTMQVSKRLEGARRAMEARGLPPEALTVIETESLDVMAGRRAAVKLLLPRRPAGERPTAVFCANDLVALGVLQEADRLKVRIPQELAIVGYDDIDFATSAILPLTSISQPRADLGRTAAELLLAESEALDAQPSDDGEEPAPHQHRQVLFRPTLEARLTTVPAYVRRAPPGAEPEEWLGRGAPSPAEWALADNGSPFETDEREAVEAGPAGSSPPAETDPPGAQADGTQPDGA